MRGFFYLNRTDRRVVVAVLLVAVAAAGLLLCAGYARASRLQAWPEMLLPWCLAAEKALPVRRTDMRNIPMAGALSCHTSTLTRQTAHSC